MKPLINIIIFAILFIAFLFLGNFTSASAFQIVLDDKFQGIGQPLTTYNSSYFSFFNLFGVGYVDSGYYNSDTCSGGACFIKYSIPTLSSDQSLTMTFSDHSSFFGSPGMYLRADGNQYNTSNHFYAQISSNGSWVIGIRKNGFDTNYITGLTFFIPGVHTSTFTAIGNHLALYLDGNLIGSYNTTDILDGRLFGFSITQCDLKEVKFADEGVTQDLSVPLLKQTDPSWASNEYDSAHTWSPNSYTIGDYGCALTSAAMVFKYYGINKLPDGTMLNPGSLNTWLKNQKDGYIGDGYLNWLALSRLSKQAVNTNAITNFDALAFTLKNSQDTAKVTSDLQSNIPDILQVHGSSASSMHFVVAKGIAGSTFNINDPYYSDTSLSGRYANSFDAIKTFAPKQANNLLSMKPFTSPETDLSYMFFTIDPSYQLIVKDANGVVVSQEDLENPIENDTSGNSSAQPLLFVYVPKPESGNYTVTVSGKNGPFTVNEYFYNTQGDVTLTSKSGVISKGTTLYTVAFTDNNSITLDTLRNDIQQAYTQKKMDFGVYTALMAIFDTTQLNNQNGIKPLFQIQLNAMMSVLTAQQKHMESDVYQVLLSDLQYLLNH